MHSSKSAGQTSKSFRVSLSCFLLACRPKTLSAAVVPVLVGAAVTHFLGYRVDAGIAWCALLSASLIQIGTNLFNDALDFEKGADSHTRLGPQRATHMGWFTPRQVKWAASWCYLLATLAGIPLVLRGGWPIVLVGLASLLSGYLYTGGPQPLAYVGLGDIFVMIFFGLVAVMGTVYLLSGHWLTAALVAGLQVGALATVLIAINNFRDMISDRASGKKTLPARFGPWFARGEIAFMFLLAFGLLFYWPQRHPAYLLLFLPSVSLAIIVVLGAWFSEPSEKMNRLLHFAALAQMTFGLALAGLLTLAARAF
jgi:1,4-dihydroxy-2-naphthoate octaprenyltransferase